MKGERRAAALLGIPARLSPLPEKMEERERELERKGEKKMGSRGERREREAAAKEGDVEE